MSTARSILLEIKRRLGDVNAAVPGETDLMAALNRALRGIWNHGARLRSQRLRKNERFTSAVDNTVEIDDGALHILGVYDHETGRRIFPLRSSSAFLRAAVEGLETGFVMSGRSITVYPDTGNIDVTVCYIPEFTPLTDRGDDLPFPPMLDDITVEWTVALLRGKRDSVSDVEPALLPHGNTLSDYFRGPIPRMPTGRGPW